MIEFTLMYHMNGTDFHTMVYSGKYKGYAIVKEVKTRMKDYTSTVLFKIIKLEKQFAELENLIEHIDEEEK